MDFILYILLNYSKENSFGKVVAGIAADFSLASFVSKLSVKLHSETGTTFGTLPLLQAIRLPIWKL